MIQKPTTSLILEKERGAVESAKQNKLGILGNSFVEMLDQLSDFITATQVVSRILEKGTNRDPLLTEADKQSLQKKTEGNNEGDGLSKSYIVILNSLSSLRTSMAFSLPIIDNLLASLYSDGN